MNRLLTRPAYVYLIGLLYLVYKVSFVPFNLNWVTALGFLFVYAAINCIILLLLNKVIKFNYGAPFIALFWLLILFHDRWISTAEIFIQPPHIVHYKYIWLLFFVLAILTTFAVYKYRDYIASINKTLNVFFIISVLIVFCNTVLLVYTTISNTNANFNKHSSLAKHAANDRDIVWILMDTYQSSANLKSDFGYINPLDTFLTNRNFILLDKIKTRFNYTLASVSSIFNFDDPANAYSYDYGQYALRHSALTEVLKKRNYKFSNFGLFTIGGTKSNRFIRYYTPTLLFKLIDGSAVQIYMQLHMLKLYQKIWTDNEAQSSDYNLTILKQLNDSLDIKLNQPHFIWAHFLIPHGPFYKYTNGKLSKAQPVGTIATKKAYIDYLSYGNLILVKLFRDHPSLKNKIVVISGDHGSVLSKDMFKPYCAIQIPPGTDTTGISKITYLSQITAFILKANIRH